MQTKQKLNMLDELEKASDARKKEQQSIADNALHNEDNGFEKVQLVLSVNRNQRAALKRFASVQGKTSSRIVQDWIDKYCKE